MTRTASGSRLMRTRRAPALLLAACTAATAVQASPFRDALAANGGCGRHRALAADQLGPLEGGPGSRTGRDADLFGKPAGAWSEAEIRDARAVFAACETRASGAPADPALMRRFETALRRAVVIARAREPTEESSEVPQQRASDGSARTAAGTGGRGLLREGPAFIPAKAGSAKAGPATAGAPAREPGQQAAEVFRDAERIERAGAAAAMPVGMAVAAPEAGRMSAGADRERGERLALSAAFGAPRNAAFAPDAGESRPVGSPNCAVNLRSFELLQADMRMPEVESLLGCRGASDGSTTIPGLGAFETYSWTDRGGTFSVTLVFQGQRLKSKAQRGLVN